MVASCPISFHVGAIAVRTISAANSNSRPSNNHTPKRIQTFLRSPILGRIIIDLRDVDYIDSAGLGALIRLELPAIKQGEVSVKFVQISPRVVHLLDIANLTQWLSAEGKSPTG
jgi:anti-anti-sigma factor